MMRRSPILALAVICCVAWLAPSAFGQAPAVEPIQPIAAPTVADTVEAGVDEPDALTELLGRKPSELSASIKVMLLLTVLTFVPSILLTLTCYTRIIIVLSFARRAIGTPELPPSPILIGLALFLTFGVMAPTFSQVHETALGPLMAEEISVYEAGDRTATALKRFMLAQTREEDVLLALDLARAERPEQPLDTPLSIAVPAFVLSEMRTAFRMGFVLFLPFLLIDLVVAAVLLALGMFMLPPTMIAMPLKILVFVLADGWALVITSLARSFEPAL
jgi:flagellar biosynthesis protein FliP